jgi:hypothetical protein
MCVYTQESLKRKVDDEPEWTARRCYTDVLRHEPVQEAAFAPPLSSVERLFQRRKVRCRPQLPLTRQDLQLLQHSTAQHWMADRSCWSTTAKPKGYSYSALTNSYRGKAHCGLHNILALNSIGRRLKPFIGK